MQKVVIIFFLWIFYTIHTPIFAQKSVKTIVLEEQTIRGKIRKPTMVIIEAERRPEFTSMDSASWMEPFSIELYTEKSKIKNDLLEEPFSISNEASLMIIP